MRFTQDLNASSIMVLAVLAWSSFTYSVVVVCQPLLGRSSTLTASVRGAGLRWGAAEATLLVISFVALVAAAYVIVRLTAGLSRVRLRAWRWGTPIAALLVVAGFYWYSFSNQTTEGLIAGIELHTGVLVTSATRVTDVLAELAGVTILAACYLITQQELPQPTGVEDYKAKHHLFSLLLYVSAALLCVGLLEIHALFAWAATVGKDAAALATAFPLVAGMLLTSLLAVLLGPAALRLHNLQGEIVAREARVASSRNESFDAAKWLAANRIGTSPLLATVTMLSPMLTGFLANTFKTAA